MPKIKNQDQSVCWVQYNIETLIPVGTSGTKFIAVPAGFAQAKINPNDHYEFINGDKRLSKYLVDLKENNFAEFQLSDKMFIPTKKFTGIYNIKDLNPSSAFFDYIGITFKLDENKLSILYDEDNADPVIKRFFKNKFEFSLEQCVLYITPPGNHTVLLESVTIDPNNLRKKKTVTVKLKNRYNKVSVWATKSVYQK
jgi:hypothetical protein